MAYVTQNRTNTFSTVWAGIADFFAAVGRAMTVCAAAETRLRRIDALNAKSDEELAAMNLRRQDIPAYVFRDLMHI